jgi:hypothetical protein
MHRAAVMLCRDTPCKATFSHCALGSARKKISLRGWELQEPAIGIGVVGGARDAGWHMSRRFFIDNQGFFQGLEHFGSYTEATSGPVAVASCCLSLLNTLVARAPYWQSTPSKVLLGHACHHHRGVTFLPPAHQVKPTAWRFKVFWHWSSQADSHGAS